MRNRAAPAALIVLASLWGCASNGPTSTYEELGQDANTRGFGRLYPQDPDENAFVFGVGDEVVVNVADTPEMSGKFPVRQDGMITLQLVNDVAAAGETTEGLRRKIELRLAAFLRDPQVTVGVGLIQSKHIFIGSQNPLTGGTVLKKLPYEGDTTLLDIYVAMGAPSSLLDDDTHVRIIRGDPRSPRVMIINVKEIVELGYTGGNIQIRPDDMVFVPPTWLGRINAAIAGISAPFQSLFTISRSIVAVDYSVRIIQGDTGSGGRSGTTFYP